MNIGEFFVTLGVKGTEKTIGAISSVGQGLGSLSSMSLAAKAGILAAVYAFERLSTSTAHAGNEMKNFNAFTGISDNTLQKWQYAGRQVGLSNEEIAGSFKSVQNAMAGVQMGKMPEGLAFMTTELAKHGVQFDPSKALKDTEYTMKRLQDFANVEKNVNLRNWALKSMGLSEGMIAGMARTAFKPEVMAKAPTYSEREINQLDKANAAWSNLGNKVQMAFGHFNAKHGVEIVNALSLITDKIVKLVEAFIRLAELFHLFDGLGKVLGSAAKGIESVGDFAGKVAKDKKGVIHGAITNAPGFFKKVLDVHADLLEPVSKAVMNAPASIASVVSDFKNFKETKQTSSPVPVFPVQKGTHQNTKEGPTPHFKITPTASPITPGIVAPKMNPNSVQPNSTQNNNVNQTFHFENNGSDHKQVGDAAGKAVKNAFFQIPQFGGW